MVVFEIGFLTEKKILREINFWKKNNINTTIVWN